MSTASWLRPLLAVALLVGPASPALAWTGESHAGPVAIADVRAQAELGDVFAIEGVVVEAPDGAPLLVRDATGEIRVAIPRSLTATAGTPAASERVRLRGVYDADVPDREGPGMRAEELERLGAESAPEGSDAPPDAAAAIAPDRGPAAVPPSLSEAWIERFGATRRRWLEAVRALREAEAACDRSRLRAGSAEAVDPESTARREAAAAGLEEAIGRVDRTIAEARAAGVSEEVLRLYAERTGRP